MQKMTRSKRCAFLKSGYNIAFMHSGAGLESCTPSHQSSVTADCSALPCRQRQLRSADSMDGLSGSPVFEMAALHYQSTDAENDKRGVLV